jgi:glutathione S-transferase
MMIFPLQGALEGKILDRTTYPKLAAYLDRLEARDAYKKAIKVVEDKTGEKFSLAPGMG